MGPATGCYYEGFQATDPLPNARLVECSDAFAGLLVSVCEGRITRATAAGGQRSGLRESRVDVYSAHGPHCLNTVPQDEDDEYMHTRTPRAHPLAEQWESENNILLVSAQQGGRCADPPLSTTLHP